MDALNKESCASCKFCKRLRKWEYKEHGVEHSNADGFVCTVFEDEGTVIWMVGISKNALCESYERKRNVNSNLG